MFKKHISLFMAVAIGAFLLIPQSKGYSKKPTEGLRQGYVANQILVKFKTRIKSDTDSLAIPNQPQTELAREVVPQGGVSANSLAGDLQEDLF